MNGTLDTCIQIGIEIQCNLNDARMQSISMLIETCPKTNHQKLVNKREKDVGLEDMHTPTHLYYNIVPSRRRVRKKAKLF